MPRPDAVGRLDRQPQVTQHGLPQIGAGGKRAAAEIGHAREAGERQAAAGQLPAHLPLQGRDWFRPQARVLERSKALLGEKPNLFERIGSRVVAKQAQMRRIIATEARAVSPRAASPCRQRQGADGADLQKFSPIEHSTVVPSPAFGRPLPGLRRGISRHGNLASWFGPRFARPPCALRQSTAA